MDNKVKERFWIILVGLISCSLIVVFGLRSKQKLEHNHQLTIGTINDCEYGGRSNSGTVFLYCPIIVNGKKYNASSRYQTTELSFFDAEKYFIGKTFPVVYYPKNPSNSSILIAPKDFSRFGYAFPDSLKWVLKYYYEK